MIEFTATLQTINKFTIVRLPEAASSKLPSRGQVFVKGTINGQPFEKVLEPDGSWGHWFKIDKKDMTRLSIGPGDTVSLSFEVSKQWPEPKLPADFSRALSAAPDKVKDLWPKITPMARWEWVRWINATSVSETRARRVEVSISKMNSGKRRPCCFNLAACTDRDLSKNGRLMELPAII